MGIRRRARELALQILYQIDGTHEEAGRALAVFFKSFGIQDEARTYCQRIVSGVSEHREEIDSLIEKYAENWKIDRMTRIDRNILRIGAYELLYCEDIPPKVTLDEAIDIGKRFGSEESGAFINGILDRMSQNAERRETG